ncbi:hypothetical protein IBTHAUMO2_440020 [Nitrosopumilaceae archaeon]|nr:hypothetical protein IBTHAUMO2_440020 [Nitrosopumilaceae archaeon]
MMHEFKEHYIYDEAFEGKEMADLRRSDPARYQRSGRGRSASSQRRVAEAVAGFANARGGRLYIGVRDGGSVCGPGKDPEYGGFENYPGKLADHMTGSLSRYLRNESFIGQTSG